MDVVLAVQEIADIEEVTCGRIFTMGSDLM